MARTHQTKNEAPDFTLHLNEGGWPIESIQAALLADIRRELKKLNETLGCYRVRAGMDAIVRIDRRLGKHMPLSTRRRGSK